jgi:hypothetical protein
MKKASKVVAWLFIFSILFLGCYSSVTIDPTRNEREKIYSGTIESVVTEDGTAYVFPMAPTIVNDTIIGVIEGGWNPATMSQDVRQVRISISDVERVSISEIDTGLTVAVALFAAVGAALIYFVGFFMFGGSIF